MKLTILTRRDPSIDAQVSKFCENQRKKGCEVEVFEHHQNIPEGEILFIIGYLRIIPVKFLTKHKHNLVIHGSALPQGRGWSPVPWQILEGKSAIPFTLFEATPGLDDGNIYFQRDLLLDGTELFDEWKCKQWELTLSMMEEFLELYPDVHATSQVGEDSFYQKRTNQDDQIDPENSLAEIFDHLRICNSKRFPAWFEFRGEKYCIHLSKEDHSSGKS